MSDTAMVEFSKSDLERRVESIERKYGEVRDLEKRRGVVLKASRVNPCWSCRWREYDYAPNNGLGDCQHPLRSRERMLQERASGGAHCGPEALLYMRPRLHQVIRWARWLGGSRR